MNAKKCKKQRKWVRDTLASPAATALVQGKIHTVKIPIWLDYKAANSIAEIVAKLIVEDPIASSPDAQRLAGLADIMKQYQTALLKIFEPDEIAAGDHEDHKHIKVYGHEHRITAINHPHSARGVLRQAKKLFKRVEKSIGKAKAKV